VAYHVRKRKNNKWWVLEIGTDRTIDGPYDSRKEAQEALKRLSGR
jgi:hypothetical protein